MPNQIKENCLCGNTEVEETDANIQLSGSHGSTTVSLNGKFLARICPKCGRTTFWFKNYIK